MIILSLRFNIYVNYCDFFSLFDTIGCPSVVFIVFIATSSTVCPSDPFYVVTYFIKWVPTSWTYNISMDKTSWKCCRRQGIRKKNLEIRNLNVEMPKKPKIVRTLERYVRVGKVTVKMVHYSPYCSEPCTAFLCLVFLLDFLQFLFMVMYRKA